MNKCIHCQKETKNAKFCSRSCSATHNNTGICRVEKKLIARPCTRCGKLTLTRKYCSIECSSISRRVSEDQLRISNAIRQGRYRAKKYRVLSSDADLAKIKEIYRNCPEGYEVDHIIPLSKGGKHHQDNLQYLTIRENRSKGNR